MDNKNKTNTDAAMKNKADSKAANDAKNAKDCKNGKKDDCGGVCKKNY